MRPAQISGLGGCLVQGKPVTPALQTTLSIILAAGPAGISTEGIADEMYLDDMPPNWQAQSRVAVSRLRNLLRDRNCTYSLDSVDGHYSLNATIDEIDIWQLLHWDHNLKASALGSVASLLSGEPFARSGGGPLVEQARRRATASQFSIVRFLVDQSEYSILRPILPQIREVVGRAHLDEYAVSLGIEAHVLCGATNEARALVEAFERSLSEDGLSHSDGPRRTFTEALRTRERPALRSALPASVSPIAGHFVDGFSGRERELQAICEVAVGARKASVPSAAVIVGEEGSGKTALLEASRSTLQALGHQVISVVASSHVASSYLPFTSAVPELGPVVRSFANASDSAINQAARHYEMVQTLKSVFVGRSIVFLIDQAHELDTQSLFLVEHLVRASLSEEIAIVAAADLHADDAGWLALTNSLRHLDVPTIRLSGLSSEALEEIVRVRHPRLGRTVQRQCAIELFRLSRGFPALALGLLDEADPETLLLESPRVKPAESRINGLDERAKQLAAAGAVLGFEFRLQDVARLTGDSDEELVDALDALIKSRVVIERDEGDLVTFTDAAMRIHALRSVSIARAKRWHKAAASFVVSHANRARHLASAIPLVKTEVAVQALISSAMTFYQQFAYREAVGQFRTATKLLNAPLAPDALIVYATALDRMGAKGSRIRQIAYDEAQRAGDNSLALRVAISGLPDTEATDGDLARVEQLLKCDLAGLSREERFSHAQNLQRQLAAVGRTEDAATWGTTAAGLAQSGDEAAAVWLEQWANWDPSASPRSAMPTRPNFASVHDPVLRARLVQSQALDAYCGGTTGIAHDAAVEFGRLAELAGDPLRMWHAKVLLSLRESLLGREEEAANAAEEARSFAFTRGNAHGELGFLAYHTLTAWRQGTLGSWPDVSSPATFGSHLEAAGALMVEAHRDGISLGLLDRCAAITEHVLVNVSMFSIPIVAFLAEIAGLDPGRRELAKRCDAFLATMDPGHAIVGVGVGHLGPISRARARLRPPGDERDRLVERALSEAHAWGLGCWVEHLERFDERSPQLIDLRETTSSGSRSLP